jgi:DNA-binding CsgD family transcriptional regulator
MNHSDTAIPRDVWALLAIALDEIDYGVLVVDGAGRPRCLNHAARLALDSEPTPLRIVDGRLEAEDPVDARPLAVAIRNATEQGLRCQLRVARAGRALALSVVPMPAADGGEPVALIILAKQQLCEALAIQAFAASHRLTSSEARVLAALSRGEAPAAIATRRNVALSTVRTQIHSIREKTGVGSIRELLRTVSVLPPLRGVLRGSPSPC